MKMTSRSTTSRLSETDPQLRRRRCTTSCCCGRLSIIFLNPSFRRCGASVRFIESGRTDSGVFSYPQESEESAHCRFHITGSDDVEMQIAQPFPIQRAFTNRIIQDLFNQWSGFRQFLAKDSISEVIITR